MPFYIQVPFGQVDGEDVGHVGDEILRLRGITLLRISRRQFDRISKTLHERRWGHQFVAVADIEKGFSAGPLATVLMGPEMELRERLYASKREP